MSSSSTLPNRNTIITPLEQSLWNIVVDTNSDIVYSNPQNSIRFMEVGDDFSNSITTIGAISINTTSTGHIDSATDTDWFKINLNKDEQVQIDLQPTSEINALGDTLLEGIYDSQGVLIENTSNDDGGDGTNSRLLFTAPNSGDYFISASAYGNQTGSYTLTTTNLNDNSNGSFDDFDQTTNTEGLIQLDGNYQIATIESAGDVDWFKVSLQADQKIQINIESDSLSDTLLQGIYTAQGQLIANTQDDDSGLNNNARLEFTAPNTSDYFIAASSAFTGDTGSYKLKINDLAEDDFSNSLSGYGGLSIDSPATGSINFSGDTDWHKISLNAGDRIVFNLEGTPTNKGNLTDPFLQGIYNNQGLLIDNTANDNGGSDTNARLTFTAPSTSDYYIAAGASADEIGSYQLTANLITDDFESSIQTTGLLTLNQTSHGEIESSGDTDWFKLSLEAGENILISLEGLSTEQGTLADTVIDGVFNANGTLIADTSNDDSGIGTNAQLTFNVEATGDYFIAATAHNTDTGTYTIKAQPVADDYTNDNKTQGLIQFNTPITGILENTEDQDWFKVTLDANQTISIDLEGIATNQGSLSDPSLLGIYNSNSSLITDTIDDNSGSGSNSQLIFTADTKDDFFIATGSQTAELGSYTLTIQEITDDYSHDIKTQGTLSVGSPITGTLEETGDQDWFKVTLDANQTVQIDLEGTETGKGTLIDPLLSGLYNNAGILIDNTSDDDGGTGANSRLIFSTIDAGDYFIAAKAYGDEMGSYQLTTTLITDDFSSSINSTGVFSNNTAAGNIEYAGDTDWFKISLTAGQEISINLDADGSIDTFLRGIYTSNGTLMNNTTNDDSGEGTNSQLIFKANTTEDYFIAAGAYGDDVGSYQLNTALITNDDFSNSINTTAVFSDNSAAGEINYAGDTDWFKVQLTVGEQLLINLESTTADTFLHGIYDSNGTIIQDTSDDDSGENTNSQLLFVAPSTGEYFIAAGAYGSEVGNYTVTINSQTDDYRDDSNTRGLLDLNTPTTGIIETDGDSDWFKITLTENTDQLQVTLDNTNNLSLLNNIYNSNSEAIPLTYNANNTQAVFSPVESEYFIDISGSQSSNPYNLSIAEIDYSATIATSGILTSNTTVTGSISSATDIDWFKIELQANDQVLIDLEGADTDQGSLSDPLLLGIYDHNGIIIDDITTDNIETKNDDGGEGTNSRLAFRAEDAGIYYIAAGAYEGATGSYTLKVQEHPDDYADNIKTQGLLNLDTPTIGILEISNDQDWFKLSLKAGEQVQIDLEGAETDKGSLTDPIITGVYSSNGTLIENSLDDDGGEGANARLNFTASEDSDYFISASSYGDETGNYQLTATLTSIDFINDIDVESILESTDSRRGELKNPGEKNWFQISLNAGETIQLDLKGIDSSISITNIITELDRTEENTTTFNDTITRDETAELTLVDPLLAGIYHNGLLIPDTINDDGGNKKDARLIFTAQEAGDYFIAASATGEEFGSYLLETTQVIEDDFPVTNIGNIVLDSTVEGNIDFEDDIDFFRIPLTAGQNILIDLEGSPTTQGSLSDTLLQGVYANDLVLLNNTTDNNSGTETNSQVIFNATVDGDYLIAAAGYNGEIGSYTLKVQEIIDDYTNDVKTTAIFDWDPANINNEIELSGNIEASSDVDWFKLHLNAGEQILIDLEAEPTGLGTLADTELKGIYNSTGELIENTTNDDGGTDTNAQVLFTAETNGDYFIAAKAYGTEVGSYSLKYQNFIDDYTNTVNTKGSLTVGNSITGRIDTVINIDPADQDWFKLSLKAGEQVRIDMKGTATNSGSLSDPKIMGIYDSSGTIIPNTSDDDGGSGTDSLLNFTALQDDDYFISAGAYDGVVGNYQLSATLISNDFVSDLLETQNTAPITTDTTRTDEIKIADQKNWYQLELTTGQTVSIDMQGTSSNTNNSLNDPFLDGIYHNGTLLTNTMNDDGGTLKDAQIFEFTAPEDGDYFVAASAYSEDATGSYQFIVDFL